ncbi:YciI family protein [Sunxiuqinia sp. sy24]|uniref:YciI family protein n=1 Tax=Sunxiuqinia sp. sy24 TaxID=3461495 RepID=UPI004045E67A
MFIISLTYKVPVSEADKHLEAHIRFIDAYFEQGVFLLSGKKIPRTGGVVLARCSSRDELEQIICQDPFYEFGIADFEVTEFAATRAGKGLDSLLD